jgi:hypothetical protein
VSSVSGLMTTENAIVEELIKFQVYISDMPKIKSMLNPTDHRQKILLDFNKWYDTSLYTGEYLNVLKKDGSWGCFAYKKRNGNYVISSETDDSRFSMETEDFKNQYTLPPRQIFLGVRPPYSVELIDNIVRSKVKGIDPIPNMAKAKSFARLVAALRNKRVRLEALIEDIELSEHFLDEHEKHTHGLRL